MILLISPQIIADHPFNTFQVPITRTPSLLISCQFASLISFFVNAFMPSTFYFIFTRKNIYQQISLISSTNIFQRAFLALFPSLTILQVSFAFREYQSIEKQNVRVKGRRSKEAQLFACQAIIKFILMPNMCQLSLFCIQNYQITTMNASHKYRKLKTINSLETECTIDDNLDRSIKIKVNSPKEETGLGKLDLVPEEMTQAKDLTSSRDALGKNLMNVPELSRKQPEISLLEASNTTEQVQGDRIRISSKSMYRGSDCFDDSMNFREMIIINGSKNLASDGQLTGPGLIKNIISQQKAEKQSKRRQEGRFKQNFKSQQSEEVKMNNSLVESEVDFDEAPLGRQLEKQKEKSIPVSHQNEDCVKQIPQRIKLSSKYESLQSLKSERQLKQNRSNSRLKLRDYIYMVEASSKVNLKQQPQKNVKIEHPKPTPTFSQQTSPSVRKSGDHIDYNPRKDRAMLRYNVNNKMMFDVLKEDIFAQIAIAESTLNSVRQDLEEVEPSLEPSNEELMILYTIRREMKQEINRKLKSTLDSLRTQKKSANPKRSHYSNPALTSFPQ